VCRRGAATTPRASRRRLDLDHARAAVGQELARPLVAAIGQLRPGESVVHAIHLVSYTRGVTGNLTGRSVSTVRHRGLTAAVTPRIALKPSH